MLCPALAHGRKAEGVSHGPDKPFDVWGVFRYEGRRYAPPLSAPAPPNVGFVGRDLLPQRPQHT